MDKTISTGKAVIAMIGGIAALLLAQLLSQLLGSLVYLIVVPNQVGNAVAGLLYVAFAFLFLWLLCEKGLRIKLKDFRIGGRLLPIWMGVALLLPVMVSAVLMALPGERILNSLNKDQLLNILTIGIFFTGIGAGVVEEMVFRGIIMTAVERRFGKKIAVLIPSVLFGCVHALGAQLHPLSLLLLIVAGTSVGVMFSLVAMQSGSVWNSAIMHVLWNIVMIGGILSIGAEHDMNALFSYNLSWDVMFITGGDFGIEASGIAVVGYLMVAVYAYLLWHRGERLKMKNEGVSNVE